MAAGHVGRQGLATAGIGVGERGAVRAVPGIARAGKQLISSFALSSVWRLDHDIGGAIPLGEPNWSAVDQSHSNKGIQGHFSTATGANSI